MIFRKYDGQLIEIKKEGFINDKLYYNKLLYFKFNFTKASDTTEKKTHTSLIVDKYIK